MAAAWNEDSVWGTESSTTGCSILSMSPEHLFFWLYFAIRPGLPVRLRFAEGGTRRGWDRCSWASPIAARNPRQQHLPWMYRFRRPWSVRVFGCHAARFPSVPSVFALELLAPFVVDLEQSCPDVLRLPAVKLTSRSPSEMGVPIYASSSLDKRHSPLHIFYSWCFFSTSSSSLPHLIYYFY